MPPANPSHPLGSGRRATARRSPAKRETAWGAPPVPRPTPHPAIPKPPQHAISRRQPGDRREPQAESRGPHNPQAPPRLGSQGDRSPVPRKAGDSVDRQRSETPRAAPNPKPPPRLGSQGDRSPVPRKAGDSVESATGRVEGAPPTRAAPTRNPPAPAGGSTSATGRVEGGPKSKPPPRLGSHSDHSPVPRKAGDSVGSATRTPHSRRQRGQDGSKDPCDR